MKGFRAQFLSHRKFFITCRYALLYFGNNRITFFWEMRESHSVFCPAHSLSVSFCTPACIDKKSIKMCNRLMKRASLLSFCFPRIQECRQRSQTGGGVHEQEAQSGWIRDSHSALWEDLWRFWSHACWEMVSLAFLKLFVMLMYGGGSGVSSPSGLCPVKTFCVTAALCWGQSWWDVWYFIIICA